MDADRLPFEELLGERKHLRSDLRLLERAVREDWPIPLSSRERLVRRLQDLIDRPTGELSVRETLRVVRVAMAMSEADLRATSAPSART